jgi:hypothetical protein
METLVAIAITSLLVTVLAMVVQQLISAPERGNAQAGASHSVQNAAHWLSEDGQAASSAIGGDGLSLTLPDSSPIEYSLSGGNLVRTVGATSIIVAENIAAVNFNVNGKMITMDIASGMTGRYSFTDNQTCRVVMRVTG